MEALRHGILLAGHITWTIGALSNNDGLGSDGQLPHDFVPVLSGCASYQYHQSHTECLKIGALVYLGLQNNMTKQIHPNNCKDKKQQQNQ